MTPLTVGSLFAGIGGFDLGLERTGGFKTEWFCEQDKFCQRVLAKHWPGVPCHEDVCRLTGASVSPVDVLCEGFPCQDLSYAGKGAGISEGTRSGLWFEYARIVGEVRPRYVIVENVSALLGRGLGIVLGDLAALGYDTEWDCIPASAVGAPHQRDRLWIVAYSSGARSGQDAWCIHADESPDAWRPTQDGYVTGSAGEDGVPATRRGRAVDVANTKGDRRRQGRPRRSVSEGPHGQELKAQRLADPDGKSTVWATESWRECDYWATEPDVGRVANGIPSRVDRLRSLGNALVPQIAEWIGWRILQWETANVTP